MVNQPPPNLMRTAKRVLIEKKFEFTMEMNGVKLLRSQNDKQIYSKSFYKLFVDNFEN